MSRRKIVAGNWKMNGGINANAVLLSSIKERESVLGGAEVVVFPPFPYLAQVKSLCNGSSVAWGAQNLSQYQSGAYTGEVSAEMLQEFGCKYVLVGHSERRALYGDSDEVVAAKFAAAAEAGLVPILCVGETLAEREAGLTEHVIKRQLQVVLGRCGVVSFSGAVVAYEPVWAIGTGKTATPVQVQQTHSFIRNEFSLLDATVGAELRILYGGSVKASNAVDIFALPDVDGGLVGGASLVASDFLPIVDSAM